MHIARHIKIGKYVKHLYTETNTPPLRFLYMGIISDSNFLFVVSLPYCLRYRVILDRALPSLGHTITTTTVANGTIETWWRHQMETFSALLAICTGNSPVTGEFP